MSSQTSAILAYGKACGDEVLRTALWDIWQGPYSPRGHITPTCPIIFSKVKARTRKLGPYYIPHCKIFLMYMLILKNYVHQNIIYM